SMTTGPGVVISRVGEPGLPLDGPGGPGGPTMPGPTVTHCALVPSSYQRKIAPVTVLYQRSPTTGADGGSGSTVMFGAAITPPARLSPLITVRQPRSRPPERARSRREPCSRKPADHAARCRR